MRKVSFVIAFLTISLLAGCNASNKKSEIKLASGNKVEISFDEERENGKTLKIAVDAETTNKIVSEKVLENDVREIWESAREKIEAKDLDEAIIRYKYVSDQLNQNQEPERVFVVTVFLAEKIENGTWKIDKIG